jgi:hypothetical protein
MATSHTPAASTTINLRRRGALAVAATVVAASTLGVTATAYAKNGGDSKKKDVRSSVACGKGSLKLKAKSDDGGRIEVEGEVDRNVVGEKWTLSLTDNGKTVWTGDRTTAGASGSFSFSTTLNADGSPTDVPTGTPTDTPTGTPTDTPADTPSSTDDTTSPTGDDSTATTSDDSTTSPTGDDSTATTSDDTSTSPTTSDDSTATTSDDSTATTTSSTTVGEDNPDRAGDDNPGFRLSSKGGDDKGDDKGGKNKGGDDKPGDDKGGQTKAGNGKHEIAVSATLDTLNCGTKVTL